MQPSVGRRRFMQSAAATGSFLTCYGVVDRSRAEVPVRITAPVVDKLTIQAVVDTNHDIFISGAPAEGVEIERVRSPVSFNGRTLKTLPIDHLIPMHCSGSNFIEAAKREMPEKLILCTTGSRFTFTA
jgi:hypothetical protein